MAIGINSTEIPWESLDDNGVKGIILFAVGNDHKETTSHLKLLSLFARKLGNDEVVKELLQSKSPEDVVRHSLNEITETAYCGYFLRRIHNSNFFK